jgi:hypothetical protein
LPSSRLVRSDLPLVIDVVVNAHEVAGSVQAQRGTARIVGAAKIEISTPDGTVYTLTRDSSGTTPIESHASDESAKTSGGTTDAAGNVNGQPAADGGDNTRAGGATPSAGGSGGARAANDPAAGTSAGTSQPQDAGVGSAGTNAPSDKPIADASAESGAPVAGGRSDPAQMDASTDASMPEARPTDGGWHCFDSETSGQTYCNCAVSGLYPNTDECTLPKPTCCYRYFSIFDMCVCYAEDSSQCDNLRGGGADFIGATIVTQCPPRF